MIFRMPPSPSKPPGTLMHNRDLSASSTSTRTAVHRPTEQFLHITGEMTSPVPLGMALPLYFWLRCLSWDCLRTSSKKIPS
ncbi:hypothetical protein BS17DRAFT_782380, partial [Gyrodon lividus]